MSPALHASHRLCAAAHLRHPFLSSTKSFSFVDETMPKRTGCQLNLLNKGDSTHDSPYSRNRRFGFIAYRPAHRGPRFQPGSSTDVLRRCVPSLQCGNTKRIKDNAMHDEATCKPECWLPGGHGPRSCSTVQEDCFELIRKTDRLRLRLSRPASPAACLASLK